MSRLTELRRSPNERAYTIIELSIVISIVGILSTVGGSQYMSYLERARTARAIAELQAIAKQLERLPDEAATYPASLADVGITLQDPWGNAYRYLVISGNLPRGLSDATTGLPHVAAPRGGGSSGAGAGGASGGASTQAGTGSSTDPASGKGSGGSGSGGAGGTGGGGSAGRAGGGSGSGGGKSAGPSTGSTRGRPDGGGSIMGEVRKDRFQVPINSDFDLYSMGPDGETRAPLSPPVSRDDIIRANDGAYYGVAAEF
ncbi:prepilin-type N-terminal cleavage/methylation domain-containing protein [Myxococcota bacterium]|nr:prepilin-type N-terminal cleavage/methylation domain-containing protein [Myxococcota bacterium]